MHKKYRSCFLSLGLSDLERWKGNKPHSNGSLVSTNKSDINTLFLIYCQFEQPTQHDILNSSGSQSGVFTSTGEALPQKPPPAPCTTSRPSAMSPHNSSSSTSSNEGAAFPWILEHLLAYPGTYEIPLRTMYTLNSTPQAQQPQRQSLRPGTPSLSSSASSPDSSPASPNFPPEHQQNQFAAQSATDHFKSCLMTHISKLPSQPFSLPPSFITSFVRRCFPAELCQVDFTQALTALDYLKDLENRRKRELTVALQRLGIDTAIVDNAGGEISKNAKISEWVLSMQNKENKVEALYSQVYIGLRRWVCTSPTCLKLAHPLTQFPDPHQRNAS